MSVGTPINVVFRAVVVVVVVVDMVVMLRRERELKDSWSGRTTEQPWLLGMG